ncbi:MAG: MATE family efflux transporter [Clostridiales bacterium]|nr:MATE family efflux transporter [Clostridiales bacterium]
MDLLKDNPIRIFYRYLFPAVSAAVAIAIYSFVDTIVIGQDVGPNGTAACAIVLPCFTIAHCIDLICGIGGSVLMSRARGEGNQEKGNAYFTASLIYVGIVTAIFWLLSILFQEQIYRLFGADDVLLPYAMEYGRWIFAAFPSFVLVSFLGAYIRTDGAPKFVMNVTMIGGIINIIGDIVFVFPMGMGMTGAALATVLGSLIQSVILIRYILLGKTSLRLAKPFQWFKAIKNISALGIGAGVTQIAMTLVTYIINNQIMKYSGSDALAVYGMLSTVTALFISIFAGIGQAAQPVVSVNYGANQKERYQIVGKLGLKVALISGLVCFGLCALFPSQMVSLFMKVTPGVAEIAPNIIRVYAMSYLPMAISLFVTAYLQSVGRANLATLVSMLRGVILSAILLYVLPLLMGGSGIWWAVTIAESGAAIIGIVYMMPELIKA